MPTSYQPLFRIAFKHAFFADGILRAVRITPSVSGLAMLRRAGLRAAGAAGDKVLFKRMPNASVGKRFRDSKDGNEILVSEIFINQ